MIRAFHKGFTLIEIMLSVAVISGLIALGTNAFFQVVSRVAVANAEESFQSSVRRAQLLARNQTHNTNWGIYLTQDTSSITIYAGDNYATRDLQLDESIKIDPTIEFDQSPFELNFAQISGTLTDVSSEQESITIVSQGHSRTISIPSLLGISEPITIYPEQGDEITKDHQYGVYVFREMRSVH